MSHNYWSPHAWSQCPQQEKPPQWEARVPQLESSPHSLQLGKALLSSNKDPPQQKNYNLKKKKTYQGKGMYVWQSFSEVSAFTHELSPHLLIFICLQLKIVLMPKWHILILNMSKRKRRVQRQLIKHLAGNLPGGPVAKTLHSQCSEPVKLLSRVWFVTPPWTVVYQAPPSIEFSRQEYWSGLPFPSPGKNYHY